MPRTATIPWSIYPFRKSCNNSSPTNSHAVSAKNAWKCRMKSFPSSPPNAANPASVSRNPQPQNRRVGDRVLRRSPHRSGPRLAPDQLQSPRPFRSPCPRPCGCLPPRRRPSNLRHHCLRSERQMPRQRPHAPLSSRPLPNRRSPIPLPPHSNLPHRRLPLLPLPSRPPPEQAIISASRSRRSPAAGPNPSAMPWPV